MADTQECPNCGAIMDLDPYGGAGCPECDHWDPPMDADWACDCPACKPLEDKN